MTRTRLQKLSYRQFYADLARRILAHRYAPLILGLLAALSILPSIGQGIWGDDLIHRAWLRKVDQVDPRLVALGLIDPNSGELGTVLMDLFAFTSQGFAPDRLIDTGIIPWWTRGGTSISFWRPVSAFTHWLDYVLWPNSIPMMHIHNLIWFGLLIAVLTLLYRRFITPAWVAGFAALLFLLDDAYYLPVLRVSQRNIQISLFFGILAILAHDSWRRKSSRRAGLAAPVFLLLSLLGSESGIATVAYLFAYELFLGSGSWRKRAASLIPAAAVVVGWRLVWTNLGFGVSNSGLYADPLRDPIHYLRGVLERGPILLFGQWGFPPPEVYTFFSDSAQKIAWGFALLFLASLAVLFYPLLRKDRVAAFWTTGMVISVIPATALNIPSQRLLFFVGVGGMGLLSQFVGGMLEKADWVPKVRFWRRYAWTYFVILLVIHLGFTIIGRSVTPMVISLGKGVGDAFLEVGTEPELEDKDLIIVNSPSPFLFLYFPFERAENGAPMPRRTRILAPAFSPFAITRTGENEAVLWTPEGDLFSLEKPPRKLAGNLVFTLWRANDTFQMNGITLGEGDQMALSDLIITVPEFDQAGLPTRIVYSFKQSLDDPNKKWLRWDWDSWSYVPFQVPPIGETTWIDGPFE